MEPRQTIVISAVNLISGGPLTILRDCLGWLSRSGTAKKYRVVALVHARSLADFPGVEYIEFPASKRSWLLRLWYEYIRFRPLSRRLKPLLWLSLHDITPCVVARRRAVYMHNPVCGWKLRPRDLAFGVSLPLFALFYKYLYRIGIHRNDFCVVQQSWFRDTVSAMFRVAPDRIVVARPFAGPAREVRREPPKPCRRFFFPSLPRPFKNFETVCRAARILVAQGLTGFSVVMTIDGTENRYSRRLRERYGDVPGIEFRGLIPRAEMDRAYAATDCLIFPSRLETWGLPLSEFALLGRPMIAADLPYAREAAEGSVATAFFDPDDAAALARLMRAAMEGDFTGFGPVPRTVPTKPFARDWGQLFDILLKP